MFKNLLAITIFSMFCLTSTLAYSQEVDLIWLERDNSDSTIYYSRYINDHWTAKKSLASGSKIKLTPTIASMTNKSVAVWVTSMEPNGLTLAYSIKPNKRWQTPQPLQFNFTETTAPALIVFKHQFYLFFAGNRGDDDDIYMSIFEKSGWSDPIMVHPDNSVPDLLPEPRIIDGALTIVWQQFDGDRYDYKSQEVLSLDMSQNKQKERKLDFQRHVPRKATKNELQTRKTKVLKNKFNVNLPRDFKGVGLSKAYVPEDPEMPALHINSESD